MSAKQIFALCIDCWEMHYGIPDGNGVYSRDSGSSNHFDHAVHVFGVPDDYPPPIRNVLAHLQAGLPISDGRLEMFSLACAVTALQPTNGVKVAPPQPEPEPRDAPPDVDLLAELATCDPPDCDCDGPCTCRPIDLLALLDEGEDDP